MQQESSNTQRAKLTCTSPFVDDSLDTLNKAIDIIVQNEMLVRVTVLWASDGNQDAHQQQLSLLLCPSTTIHEFKNILQGRLNITEAEQRLSVGADQPLLSGTLGQVASACELSVNLNRIPEEQRLLNLFKMVGLGDWKERNDIMAKMMLQRNAKKCYKDHELVAIGVDDEKHLLDFKCVKCNNSITRRKYGQIEQNANICSECSFYIFCPQCIDQDTGCIAATDPYVAMKQMALDIGRKMASYGVRYGHLGHMCGYPEIHYSSEFAPRALRHINQKDQFRITPDTKVLHGGVNLVVRFDEEAREFLQSSGLQTTMLASEIQQECDNGVNVREMMGLRNAWTKAPYDGIWKALSQEWRDRFPTFKGTPYATSSYVSFSLEEVVYEVGITMSIDEEYYWGNY